ncbi:MAG: hypothetical protein JO249_11125 [Acidobacteria bacterium]|nr:hypothetical protein [Acidobacteriota bacterium]
MANLFHELRERLLRAGVAPRHIRRYLGELADHLADLTSEEERAGRSPQDAKSAALARLGTLDDLARAMIAKREFRSWCARAPWAIFGVVPLLLLAAAYFAAVLYLWFGWSVFLPDAETPFGRHGWQPLFSVANIYFQSGKLYYRLAPILVGASVGVAAARQRCTALWPMLSFILVSWMGSTAEIHASRTAVPRGLGHITMDFFAPTRSGETLLATLLYALVIFTLAALPYALLRIREAITS